MFGASVGPGAFGSNKLDGAYRLEVSQKYPWSGKLAPRGQNDEAEASAAGRDVEDMRLQLAESARTAFYDYYVAARALEVNAENLRLLREFHQNAAKRYTTGLVPQQDVLQAEAEIGQEQDRALSLQDARPTPIAPIT